MASGRERFAQGLIVRLFRAWAAARSAGRGGLHRMREIVVPLGLPDETAPACASLFELVEAHLGRALRAECSCSARLSADERALLGIVSLAPALHGGATIRQVPHGLPGAICWAAMVVRRAFSIAEGAGLPAAADAGRGGCPFGTRGVAREAHHGL